MTVTAHANVFEAAVAVAPLVRDAADEIEHQRRLPRALVERMRDAGLFHWAVPRDLGGLESSPIDGFRAIEEISAADGSAGWCVMIASQCAVLAGFLPEHEAQTVLADRAIVASVARPIGRATVNGDGTYIVSGRWPFASGSSHADWLAGECVVYDGEDARKDSEGNPVSHMLFFPASEATIHDTWNTTGLRGTASNDFSVDGIRVPVSRGFRVLVDAPVHPWAYYRTLPLMFVSHGAQAVGVGRAALAAARTIATTKPGWGSDRPIAENTRVQAIFADAVVTLESARAYLYAKAAELWEATVADRPDAKAMNGGVRLATCHAAAAAVRAVDLVHGMVGTSALFAANPLERRFRDIHTAAAHVMIGPLAMEAAGRVELGLEPRMPFF